MVDALYLAPTNVPQELDNVAMSPESIIILHVGIMMRILAWNGVDQFFALQEIFVQMEFA